MLKNYASYFVAYLLDNLEIKDITNIKKIILYGSAAKDQATKESDIDTFIDVKKKSIKFEKEIKKIEEKFYQSRESVLFKSRNIDNKFNVKVGKLKDWKELYKSIISTGIILYGRYELAETPSGTRPFAIIFWKKIGKNRGAFLNRIYGFKIKEKHYLGLVSKFDGRRLGKSCIMIPIQYKEDIFKLLREYKVDAKILEVFS